MRSLIIISAFVFCYIDFSFAQKPIGPYIGKHTGKPISIADLGDINSKNYSQLIKNVVFPDARLKDLIKTMSKNLNINIMMDPTVGGSQKINIITYSPITVAEYYQAFLSALAMHGLAMVKTGAFYKIIKTETALKSNLQVFTKDKKIGMDQFATHVIKLNNIDVETLQTHMKPFIDEKAVQQLSFVAPTNSVIISDYGLNVDRIRKIIQALDKHSEDDFIKLKIFPIEYGLASDLVKMVEALLNPKKSSSTGRWMPKYGSPSFRGRRNSRRSSKNNQRSGVQSLHKGSKVIISAIAHDERTNSIIMMGNNVAIEKVAYLIKKLDTVRESNLKGEIKSYDVKYGKAETLAETLKNILHGETQSAGSGGKQAEGRNKPRFRPGHGIDFKGLKGVQSFKEIRIISDSNTNKLLITANKYDYEMVLELLKELDVAKNQVFIKTIIMELTVSRTNDWKIANYFFPKASGGLSKIGYGLSSLTDLSSFGDGATTLTFPLSLFFSPSQTLSGNFDKTNITSAVNLIAGSAGQQSPITGLEIPSLTSFISFLHRKLGADIISTPQLMALDHEQATLSIKEKIPIIGSVTSSLTNSEFQNISRDNQEIETNLQITPHISPEVNSVTLEISQKMENLLPSSRVPKQLENSAIATKESHIKTQITLKNQETAVLGGLIKEQNDTTETKIPILGDLPLIGWLFKNKKKNIDKSQLIVFITPQIIYSEESNSDVLSDQLKKRMQFIRQFIGDKDPYQKQIQEEILKENTSEKKDSFSSAPSPLQNDLPYESYEDEDRYEAQEPYDFSEDSSEKRYASPFSEEAQWVPDKEEQVEEVEEGLPSSDNSPSVDSPSVDSPSVDSPSVDSPSVDSPSVDSPFVDSPSVDSPSVDSPSVDLPSSAEFLPEEDTDDRDDEETEQMNNNFTVPDLDPVSPVDPVDSFQDEDVIEVLDP